MNRYCLNMRNDPDWPENPYVFEVLGTDDWESCMRNVELPPGWGPPVEAENSVNVTADIFIGCLLVLCFIGGWIAGGQR